jgi:hypothetical protein
MGIGLRSSTPTLTLIRRATVKRTESECLWRRERQNDSYHPDTQSDFWHALCGEAGVSKIRLHDARRACGMLMHMQGLPIVVISQWLGHADPAFTMRAYVHSQDDALTSRGGLGRSKRTLRASDHPSPPTGHHLPIQIRPRVLEPRTSHADNRFAQATKSPGPTAWWVLPGRDRHRLRRFLAARTCFRH